MQNSQELIISGCIVKVSLFLIHEECIRDPDELNVLSTNNQLFKTNTFVKGQSGVLPELSEVHVEGEVLQIVVREFNTILFSCKNQQDRQRAVCGSKKQAALNFYSIFCNSLMEKVHKYDFFGGFGTGEIVLCFCDVN
jgi:hypothetical protein